jgi:hypothetical protein
MVEFESREVSVISAPLATRSVVADEPQLPQLAPLLLSEVGLMSMIRVRIFALSRAVFSLPTTKRIPATQTAIHTIDLAVRAYETPRSKSCNSCLFVVAPKTNYLLECRSLSGPVAGSRAVSSAEG